MTTLARSITDAQFEQLRKLIYDRAGIDFQASRKYVLETRLSRRLEELHLDNFDQYLMFLTVGPYRDDEFQEMINRVTINETSFFRNGPQLEVFEKHVLPAIIEARRGTRQLRIWSCACSTGEEPYTLAIQVHRTLGLRLADWRVEVIGTDISERVLMAAQDARYAAHSVRNVQPLVLQRYFTHEDGFYQVSDEVRSMVHFDLLNLKDGFAARRYGTFDVIFCRNVMIYFDEAMKAHCVRLFERQLAGDGTLFIGHSETLRQTPTQLHPVPRSEAFAYGRPGAHPLLPTTAEVSHV